ncbi:MAG TPA: AAA family ATPase [Negativicutes bacterium]|nr:AAA family ATPase [Negativicutes bacterium]
MSSENTSTVIQGDSVAFVVGVPVLVHLLSKPEQTAFSTRIVEVSLHTFSISIPYDDGKILLWPVGARIEVSMGGQDAVSLVFPAEIIGRDITGNHSYTLMRPTSVSRSGRTAPASAGAATSVRVIAVTSGKGGVGKTTLTTNLAVAFAAAGKKVVVIDTDLGTANVDVVLGLSPQYHLGHVVSGQKGIMDIALPAPGGFMVIPGGSGLQELTQLSESQFTRVITGFNELDGRADMILLDTGAGISRDVSNFLLASDEIVFVTTPEPHAMTDAYAIIKVMHTLHSNAKKRLIINKVEGDLEAGIIASRLTRVVSQYLNEEIEFLGGVEENKAISRSLKKQCPLMLMDPDCISARNIARIADKIIGLPPPAPKGVSGFVRRLIDVFHPGKK